MFFSGDATIEWKMTDVVPKARGHVRQEHRCKHKQLTGILAYLDNGGVALTKRVKQKSRNFAQLPSRMAARARAISEK